MIEIIVRSGDVESIARWGSVGHGTFSRLESLGRNASALSPMTSVDEMYLLVQQDRKCFSSCLLFLRGMPLWLFCGYCTNRGRSADDVIKCSRDRPKPKSGTIPSAKIYSREAVMEGRLLDYKVNPAVIGCWLPGAECYEGTFASQRLATVAGHPRCKTCVLPWQRPRRAWQSSQA